MNESPVDTIATQELVSFIGLTLLESNPVFSRGINFVYNDTLVGVSHDNHKYFYKSLAENGPVVYIDLIDPPRDIFHSSNYPDKYPSVEIKYLKDGFLYFFNGAGYLWKLNINGTIKNYIGVKYKNEIGKPVNFIKYNSYVIIHAFNGIFILDMESEELVWDYNFSKATNLDANPTLVGNKLFFINRNFIENYNLKPNNKNTILVCLDLNKLEILWEREFERTYLGCHGGGVFGLPNNGKDVIGLRNYYTDNSYFINLNNGEIILEKDSIIVYNLGQRDNRFSYSNFYTTFDNHDIFIGSMKSRSLVKLNLIEDYEYWRAPEGLGIVFIYELYMVTYNAENHSFVVLDKNTGEVLNTIPLKGKYPHIVLKEQYIQIGSSIYK